MKDPIQKRTCFFTRRWDGSIVDCDWNVVNHATLGVMMEPRMVSLVARDGLVQLDLDDISFNHRLEVDENVMFQTYGTWGNQLPADYNTR
jgi:hypothetical protein